MGLQAVVAMRGRIAKAVFVGAVLFLSACEMPAMRPGGAGSATAQTPVPQPGLSTQQRLRRALGLLEEGDEVTARVELQEYMANVRSSAVGSSLLRQIDTPADEYYPAEYREVILRRGQSLSNIAETYLGSAIEFHALAKYNEIERPKRIFIGQIVKVPLTPAAEEAFAELADALDQPGAQSMPLADTAAAEELDVAGEADAGADPDASGPPAGDPEAAPAPGAVVGDERPGAGEERIAADSPPSSAGQAYEAASREVAPQVLGADTGAVPEAASGTAAGAGAAGKRTADSTAAAAADTASEASAGAVAAVAPPVDVDALHRRAINAYRAQDLDTAIGLWNEVLEADPGYEGARLYRSQALALKKRLKALN